MVCGADVAAIVDSDLYLRYILGEVPMERLHLQSEQHIRCNPELAQYITDEHFEPIGLTGPFAKAECDPEFVAVEERRVTRAWHRLQAIPRLGLSIAEYPLSVTSDDTHEKDES